MMVTGAQFPRRTRKAWRMVWPPEWHSLTTQASVRIGAQPPMPRQVSTQVRLAAPAGPAHWARMQAAVSVLQGCSQRAATAGAAAAATARAASRARRVLRASCADIGPPSLRGKTYQDNRGDV